MRAISKSEFARERDFSRARLYQLIDDGRLAPAVITEGEDAGKIDADKAHAILDATLDQAKGIRREGNVTSSAPSSPAASGPDSPQLVLEEEPERDTGSRSSTDQADYWKSRARREAAEAEISEMKARERAGELVSAADVKREIAELARATRNALLAIADRVSPVLDPRDPARAHKLLTDEIGRALRELSGKFEERAGDPGASGSAPTVQ